MGLGAVFFFLADCCYAAGVSTPLFRRELCWAALPADDAGEVMVLLARALADQGFVRSTFEDAVVSREASSPTGLPMAGRKVAIPHADPEHVIAPAVALCALCRPVGFKEMGNPQCELPVELVAMLALPDEQSAQHELVRLIELFQDAAFVDRLCTAADGDAIYALLCAEGEVS